MVVRVAATIVRMGPCDLVRSLGVATLEPIGHRAIVMEAVTEIGVLRPFGRNRVENVAVD
jgi:hypothetical protein